LIINLFTSCAFVVGVGMMGVKDPYGDLYFFNAPYKNLKDSVDQIFEHTAKFNPSPSWGSYISKESKHDEFYIVVYEDNDTNKREILLKLRYFGDQSFKDTNLVSGLFIAGMVYPKMKWNDNPSSHTERKIAYYLQWQFLSYLNLESKRSKRWERFPDPW
jgi:hypothetical protein